MKVAFDNISNDFKFRISREGNFAWEHDIEYDTKRPDVNFRVVVLQENLWRDVVWLDTKIEVRL